MGSPQSGREILDQEYLLVRAKILEIAAVLERISRAEGTTMDDPRWAQLRRAIELVLEQADGRAEQVQLLFSQAYDPGWRENLDVK